MLRALNLESLEDRALPADLGIAALGLTSAGTLLVNLGPVRVEASSTVVPLAAGPDSPDPLSVLVTGSVLVPGLLVVDTYPVLEVPVIESHPIESHPIESHPIETPVTTYVPPRIEAASSYFAPEAASLDMFATSFAPARGGVQAATSFLAPESPALGFRRTVENHGPIERHTRPLNDPLAVEPPIKRETTADEEALVGFTLATAITKTSEESDDSWEAAPTAPESTQAPTPSALPQLAPEQPAPAPPETMIPETLLGGLATRVDLEAWAETATQLLDSLEAITQEPDASEPLWLRVGYWVIAVGATGLAIEAARQGLRARSQEPELPQLLVKR